MRSWIPGFRTRRPEAAGAALIAPTTLDPARPVIEEDLGTASPPWLMQVGRRLLRNPAAMLGLALLLLVVLVAIFAPLIARYDPNRVPQIVSITQLNQGPTGAHWFGTDYVGRDLWARVVYGARVSLPAGLGIVLISFALGTPLGIIAGYGSRLLDDLIARFIDILLTLPGLLLAIVLVSFLGSGLKSVIIAVGVAGIPGYARIARGSTLSVKRSDYVEAARAQGASALHIMFRHIFPNIVDPIVILATLNLSGGILAAAALSFIGLGTSPPQSDWGTLLSSGYEHMFQSGAEIYFPGLAILITVLGINLLGDGLGDALNPRLRGG